MSNITIFCAVRIHYFDVHSDVLRAHVGIGCDMSLLSGFEGVLKDFYVEGGIELAVSVTDEQCRELCLILEACMSVDYNWENGSCWYHTKLTHCNIRNFDQAYTHYEKRTCGKRPLQTRTS